MNIEKAQASNDLTSLKVIVECLAVIKDLHPSWNVDDINRTARLWHYSLKEYNPSEVKKATYDIASKSKYIPKLSDLLEYLETKNIKNQHIQIGADPQSEEKRLRRHLETLSELEKQEFDKRVQEYVISRQGPLNEFEMISATIMIELIDTYKQKGIENESIDRYLRLQ